MSPVAHLSDDCAEHLTCKYESLMQRNFVEIIPTMKFSSDPILQNSKLSDD
jgi:hypothetical protein